MINLRTCVLLGMVAICAFIASSNCAAIEPDGWFQYTLFFKRLSRSEKHAVMTLAIAYHDTPENSNDPIVFPTNPVRPQAEEIPPTLYAKMMNGNIPKNWFQNFVKWMQDGLEISENSLNLYRHNNSDVLYSETLNKEYSIDDVGQQCCPFG